MGKEWFPGWPLSLSNSWRRVFGPPRRQPAGIVKGTLGRERCRRDGRRFHRPGPSSSSAMNRSNRDSPERRTRIGTWSWSHPLHPRGCKVAEKGENVFHRPKIILKGVRMMIPMVISAPAGILSHPHTSAFVRSQFKPELAEKLDSTMTGWPMAPWSRSSFISESERRRMSCPPEEPPRPFRRR